MSDESLSSKEFKAPLVIKDVREFVSDEKFSEVMEALEAGIPAEVRTEDNSIYNKGFLRATQKGIRQKAADEALKGIGQPATPVAKLIRRKSEKKGQPIVQLLVLNGHHRTGVRLINNLGVELMILLAQDYVDKDYRLAVVQGLDFDDPGVLDKYGLKKDPRKVATGYGFNTILRKLRHYYQTGEVGRVIKSDPVNDIRSIFKRD